MRGRGKKEGREGESKAEKEGMEKEGREEGRKGEWRRERR